MPIALEKDANDRALSSLRRYCSEELDVELGELQAGLLLTYILAEIGPSVYNMALADAQTFLRDRVGDLEDAMHQHEFGYWQQRGGKRPAR